MSTFPTLRTTCFCFMILIVFILLTPGLKAQIIFQDGFESGKLDRNKWDVTWWTDHQLPDGIQPEIVTSPVRAGKYAVKMRIEYQWNGVENYDRTELQAKRNDTGSHISFFDPNGKEYWIGFSCYFPEDWAKDSKEELIFQFHGNGGGRSPSLALYIDGDEWYWYVRWQPDRNKPDETAGEKELWRARYQKGVWVDWVLHAIWSYHDDGYLEIYKNDTSVVVYKGPNCYNDELGIRGPQTGIYKWPWLHGPTDVTERVIYLDEFAVGGANSSYADVAPSTVLKADMSYKTGNCESEVSFTNASSSKLGEIDSCLWDFGDGEVSKETNPIHRYAKPGSYKVTLTVFDSTFTDVDTDSVRVYFASLPEDVEQKKNEDGTFTLTATGSGTIYWYDTISAGEVVGTGSPFTTGVTDKTTFYAANVIGGETTFTGGKKEKGSEGDYYKWEDKDAVWGLQFDTETDMELLSVKVYNGESESGSYTGERTFTIVNASGDTVAQKTVEVIEGEQRLELDMAVPAGTGYRLLTDRHVGLWRDTGGASYPYYVGPTVTITGGIRYDGLQPSDRSGYYYFFYDWEVTADLPQCESRRVGTDGTLLVRKNPEDIITLYPNPVKGFLTIDHLPLNANEHTINLYNNTSQLVRHVSSGGKSRVTINTSDLASGLYFCKITEGCHILCVKKVMIVK